MSAKQLQIHMLALKSLLHLNLSAKRKDPFYTEPPSPPEKVVNVRVSVGDGSAQKAAKPEICSCPFRLSRYGGSLPYHHIPLIKLDVNFCRHHVSCIKSGFRWGRTARTRTLVEILVRGTSGTSGRGREGLLDRAGFLDMFFRVSSICM